MLRRWKAVVVTALASPLLLGAAEAPPPPKPTHAMPATIEIGDLLYASYMHHLPAGPAHAPERITLGGLYVDRLEQMREQTAREKREVSAVVFAYRQSAALKYRFGDTVTGYANQADVQGMKDYVARQRESGAAPGAETVMKVHTHPGQGLFSVADIMGDLRDRQPGLVVAADEIYLSVPSGQHQMTEGQFIILATGDIREAEISACTMLGKSAGEAAALRMDRALALYEDLQTTIYRLDPTSGAFLRLRPRQAYDFAAARRDYRTNITDAIRVVFAQEGFDGFAAALSRLDFGARVSAEMGQGYESYGRKLVGLMKHRGGGVPSAFQRTTSNDLSPTIEILPGRTTTGCVADRAVVRFFPTVDTRAAPTAIYDVALAAGAISVSRR